MASSSSHPASSGSSDVALPKALTDFIFDLYDSVTMSQDSVEQAKLYGTEFRDLSTKYFGHQPWPSPQSIASECNGDPLFLAVYREMTHRHWHQVVLSRPSIRDRLEGFAVYRELFDEILEAAEDANFELLPTWVFDIFQEFGYQFQGFCQVRSAVYASARKHGWITVDEDTHTVTLSPAATAALSNPSSNNNNNNSNNNNNNTSNLLDNLTVLEQNRDAWDVEIVFSYLHRFAELGLPTSTMTSLPPVYTYFNMFATLTKSRLECLLGDFTASLQALTPLSLHASFVIPSHTTDAATKTTSGRTVAETLESVVAAKLSLSYHCSISLMMLRRYKDAARLLGQVCATVLRGFKTGQLRKVPGSEQFHKQVERMLSLLALLHYVLLGHATTTTSSNSRNKRSPTTTTTTDEWMDDAVARVLRDKHAARLEATSSYEEWFASPKFVTTNYTTTTHNVHKHLVQVFLRDIPAPQTHRTVASYLQLYTTLPLSKLTLFYQSEQDEAKKQSKTNPKNTTTTATTTTDATTAATRTSQEDMMALVLSYKLRHWQWEHVAPPASTNISWLLWNYDQHKGRKDALELHFHVQADKDQKSMTLCMLEEDDDETDDSKDTTTTTNKSKTTMSNQYYKTMQRRHYYETYFVSRLEQSVELRQWLQRPSLDPSDVVRAATAVGSSS